MDKKVKEITDWIKSNANSKNTQGMKRFGINVENAYGIPTPAMKAVAKKYTKDHVLALALWDTGIHEARIIAAMIADPAKLDRETMEKWCNAFDSWDLCDQCCLKLFRYTPLAPEMIMEWAPREDEFVRRAAFSLVATLSVGDKKSPDSAFEPYFDLIIKYSTDERNFVKKAVNWALRQLGKRNHTLYIKALAVCEELIISQNAAARWTGRDAQRELLSEKVISRIK